MFGVLDETGLLQYGQVFIQFTNNVAFKTPSKAAVKTILKGYYFLKEANKCIHICFAVKSF